MCVCVAVSCVVDGGWWTMGRLACCGIISSVIGAEGDDSVIADEDRPRKVSCLFYW